MPTGSANNPAGHTDQPNIYPPTKPRKESDRRSREIEYAVDAESLPADILMAIVRVAIDALLPENALAVAKVTKHFDCTRPNRMAIPFQGSKA